MKTQNLYDGSQVSTSLKLFFTALSCSMFFIQSNAQCIAGWVSSQSGCYVKFGDISQGNPTQWSWDFGNGQTSSLQDPVYTYSASGTYNVCLIITAPTPTGGNCYDTLCKNVTVQCGATGVTDLLDEQSISIYPNPSSGKFTIQTSNVQYPISNIEIYNVLGEKVYSLTNPLIHQSTVIDVSSQPKGVYFYQITLEDKSVSSGKLIIQ